MKRNAENAKIAIIAKETMNAKKAKKMHRIK